MPELTSTTFPRFFTALEVGTRVRARSALTELALVVEKQAKINARSGSHKYGTPTPARPGTGPATISGTLRRSITHTPVVRVGEDYECRIGMGVGFHPPYGQNRTPSSKYAYYLETGLRNGTKYPFLLPAYQFAIRVPADLIYRKAFGEGWTRLV